MSKICDLLFFIFIEQFEKFKVVHHVSQKPHRDRQSFIRAVFLFNHVADKAANTQAILPHPLKQYFSQKQSSVMRAAPSAST